MSQLSLRNAAGLLRWLRLRVRYGSRLSGFFFVGPRADIVIAGAGSLHVGSGTVILQDFTARIEAPVHLGAGVFFNRGCHLVAKAGIDIGDGSLLGEYVSVHDEAHVIRDGRIAGRDEFYGRPVRIGDGVWVGAKATVLPGVTVGDHCIIGANSTVTQDVAANMVAVGSPAVAVKEVPQEMG